MILSALYIFCSFMCVPPSFSYSNILVHVHVCLSYGTFMHVCFYYNTHFSLFHMQIQGSWEKKLIEKVMHNAYWKQHKRSIEEDDSSDSSTPKRKRGRPSTSQVLTRYPPLRDTGEDETASERNRQQLQRELERDRPRKETVLLLARQTFATRRSEILDETKEISASSILSKYNEIEKPYVVCKLT